MSNRTAFCRCDVQGATGTLRLMNLAKSFGTRTVIDDLTLEVPAGQMLGIIGRSGAGKSTLLRCINRLEEASGGDILYSLADQEHLIGGLKGRELRHWRMLCAMVFQQFNLIPRLNVIMNVLMGRLNHNRTWRSLLALFEEKDRACAVEALERLDLGEQTLQRADTLSGGQQQRVAIARALVQEPRILLADEPISSLDAVNAQIVMEALRKINREYGITVISSLHSLETAKRYCDRIIGLKAGKIIFDETADNLTDNAIRDVYLDQGEIKKEGYISMGPTHAQFG